MTTDGCIQTQQEPPAIQLPPEADTQNFQSQTLRHTDSQAHTGKWTQTSLEADNPGTDRDKDTGKRNSYTWLHNIVDVIYITEL